MPNTSKTQTAAVSLYTIRSFACVTRGGQSDRQPFCGCAHRSDHRNSAQALSCQPVVSESRNEETIWGGMDALPSDQVSELK